MHAQEERGLVLETDLLDGVDQFSKEGVGGIDQDHADGSRRTAPERCSRCLLDPEKLCDAMKCWWGHLPGMRPHSRPGYPP